MSGARLNTLGYSIANERAYQIIYSERQERLLKMAIARIAEKR